MRARSKPLPRRGGTQVGTGSSRGRTPGSHDALGRLQAGEPQVTDWSGGAKRLKRYSAELRLRAAACTSPAPAHAFFFFFFIYSGCHRYGAIALTSAISQPAAVPGSFQQDPSGRQQSAFSHSPQLLQQKTPTPGDPTQGSEQHCVALSCAHPQLPGFFLCVIFSESDKYFHPFLLLHANIKAN